MEEKQKFPSHESHGKVLIASLLILSGILLFTRNIGWIPYQLFNILVSWQSLFIIIGIYVMTCRQYISGTILLLIGVYFLIGRLPWLFHIQVITWPLALVVCGFFFLTRKSKKERWIKQHLKEQACKEQYTPPTESSAESQQHESNNGFLYSNNTFGAVRHVVLDNLFKGANIRTSFGGTTIDLRHTHIAPGETYIDLDCNFGGVELFVPADWKVVIRCNTFFGGCDDKRWQRGASINQEQVLIIRGNVSLGGLEIKD